MRICDWHGDHGFVPAYATPRLTLGVIQGWRAGASGRKLSRRSLEEETMKKARKKSASKASAPSKPRTEHELSEEQLAAVAGGSTGSPKGSKGQEYFQYNFTEVFVTGVPLSGGGGSTAPTESSPATVSAVGPLATKLP
jgi:hypothetical protein